MERSEDLMEELEKINTILRRYGYGQGELDESLSDCLEHLLNRLTTNHTEFDPSIDPEKYVIKQNKNSFYVMGPADLTEGACFGRKIICQCFDLETTEFVKNAFNARQKVL